MGNKGIEEAYLTTVLLDMDCGRDVGAIYKDREHRGTVCKTGSKGSSVFALGHINTKKPEEDPRSHVGIWIDESRVQKNALG